MASPIDPPIRPRPTIQTFSNVLFIYFNSSSREEITNLLASSVPIVIRR